MIEAGKVKRVGLLATQGIRGGANRRIIERIKADGDIFLAWADEPWVVEGAAVHVSFVGYDDGSETRGSWTATVTAINANLTAGIDLTWPNGSGRISALPSWATERADPSTSLPKRPGRCCGSRIQTGEATPISSALGKRT